MAEITLSNTAVEAQSAMTVAKTAASTPGNIAYALIVLFCFWLATQALNLLVHAPGLLEHLAQGSNAARPRIEMDLAVGTLFGLIPFLLGSLLLGAIALGIKLRQRRHHHAD